jgi:hypothetical protein
MASQSAELLALERAIRSLGLQRAPDGLRSALRRDLVVAADARPAVASLAALVAPAPRFAFAALAALLLITSGWAVAASAPGDLLYPLKETIVRSFWPSGADEIRVPSIGDLFRSPETVPADPADPSSRPFRTAAPVIPAVPRASAAPAATSAAEPAATSAPEPAESSDAPARATPAIPPDPAGPRATPAVPPPHR